MATKVFGQRENACDVRCMPQPAAPLPPSLIERIKFCNKKITFRRDTRHVAVSFQLLHLLLSAFVAMLCLLFAIFYFILHIFSCYFCNLIFGMHLCGLATCS